MEDGNASLSRSQGNPDRAIRGLRQKPRGALEHSAKHCQPALGAFFAPRPAAMFMGFVQTTELALREAAITAAKTATAKGLVQPDFACLALRSSISMPRLRCSRCLRSSSRIQISSSSRHFCGSKSGSDDVLGSANSPAFANHWRQTKTSSMTYWREQLARHVINRDYRSRHVTLQGLGFGPIDRQEGAA